MGKSTFDLTGRVAIVTGGSKGIGYGIAEKFAAHGASVVLVARRANECDAAAAEIAKAYPNIEALSVPGDVSKLADIENIFNKTIEKFGKLDILVNAAGASMMKPLEAVTEAEWDHMTNVNMKGLYFMSTAAKVQFLKQEKVGTIINIASNALYLGLKFLGAYAATKAYVGHITKCMAVEWAPHKIRVNAIAPGTVPTEMAAPFKELGMFDKIANDTPLQTLMNVEDMANAALYLAADESEHATGIIIPVDGGRSII